MRVGFLTKKGAFKVGGWKKRYFVLRVGPRRAVLAYYRKQTDSSPAGEIVLDQSTLAYHNVDSEKPFAFSIQTRAGRTYELLASSEAEMRSWIETAMQAALGIVDSRRAPRVVASGAAAARLRFRALGMACECCWEEVPRAVGEVEGVEGATVDAGAEAVEVQLREGAEVETVSPKIIAILEQRFGFLTSNAVN